MYEGYINAVKEVFKEKAMVVVDRYHVAKLYRGELDKFRQKTLKRLKQELTGKEYEQIISATRILRRANESPKMPSSCRQ
jgi:transposase